MDFTIVLIILGILIYLIWALLFKKSKIAILVSIMSLLQIFAVMFTDHITKKHMEDGVLWYAVGPFILLGLTIQFLLIGIDIVIIS
jgi:hypothetical protein